MGKGSSAPAPEPPQVIVPPSTDYGMILEPMMAMMAQQQAGNMALMQAQMQNTIAMQPTPTATPTIDWEARRKALQEKIETDTTKMNEGRRGRASTILTSNLAEEPVDIFTSVLTGKKA